MAKRFRRSTRRSNPADETVLPLRLHPGQFHKVAKVRALRSEAKDLRSHVSAGAYGEAERARFYKLAHDARTTLTVSNPELADRAGLGENFFPTLIRDRRYPKLENFLRALTAIIEVADERLYEIDRDSALIDTVPSATKIGQRIKQDRDDLLLLALSLSQMALDEIERLDAERPNDPDRIGSHERQRKLLQLFASGFSRIARDLSAIEANSANPVAAVRATQTVVSVGNGINKWWKKNEQEAIDWAFRIPVLTAGVAALGWAGANMVIGTTAVAALVGGKKVLQAISKRALKSATNRKVKSH